MTFMATRQHFLLLIQKNIRKEDFVDTSTIHKNIVRISKEKKIPLYAIESACGLPSGTISKWKYVSPISKNLKAVADFLEVTMDEIYSEPEEREGD